MNDGKSIIEGEFVPDINLAGTDKYDYDEWLEFFRKMPAGKLQESIEWLKQNISSDGYAAAQRWLQIFDSPNRMDKLYKAKLDREHEEDIMDVAIGDDDEAFYIALIRQNTAQLSNPSTSQQEVARLTANINIFRKELSLIRSRNIKKGTILEKVINASKAPNAKKTTRKPNAKN